MQFLHQPTQQRICPITGKLKTVAHNQAASTIHFGALRQPDLYDQPDDWTSFNLKVRPWFKTRKQADGHRVPENCVALTCNLSPSGARSWGFAAGLD
jgi:hypothetical protein